MIDRRSVPLTTVITLLLWLGAVGLIIAGWICMLAEHWHVATMLGVTSILIGLVATTETIWGFALRTQSIVRVCNGFERSEDTPPPERLRPV